MCNDLWFMTMLIFQVVIRLGAGIYMVTNDFSKLMGL